MNQLTLCLPFPPSLNSYWRKSAKGMYIDKKGREFREAVLAKYKSPVPLFTKNKRLSVQIRLFAPDRRKRDVDNYAKGLLDALAKANIFVDDSQIDELNIKRCHIEPPGRCEVTIKGVE